MSSDWCTIYSAAQDFSEEFKSFFVIQGLSGKLFTLVLAGDMRYLRALLSGTNPPVSELGMPIEWEYADDCDFTEENVKARKFSSRS